MARIKNEQKYPIKPIPVATDTVIGSDSQNFGKTVQFTVGSFGGNGSGGAQNNRWKQIKVGAVRTPFNQLQPVVDVINAYNPVVEVAEDEIPVFLTAIIPPTGESPMFYAFVLEGKGKGTYGAGGTVTVTTSDLIAIEKSLITFFDPSDEPNALVAELGEIGTAGNFITIMNEGLVEYEIVAGTNFYVEFTRDGLRELWGFEGANGTYGGSATDFDFSDFFLIFDEESQPVLESTGLELLQPNLGWRLIGRDPNNYGGVGFGAIDFSTSFSPSTTFGATGTYAVAFGENVRASGYSSLASGFNSRAIGTFTTVFGYDLQSNGYASFVTGYDNVEASSTGYSFMSGVGNRVNTNAGFAAGVALTKSNGVGTAILGTANVDVAGSNNGTSSTQPMIIIGNGTHTTPIGSPWTAVSRSNLLVGLRDGTFILPSTTIAVIDGEVTGKQVVTREWVEAQGFGGGGLTDNLYTADGQITSNQDREVTFGANSSLTFIAGGMEFFMAEDTISIDSPSWAISDLSGEAGINASNGNVLEVIGYNGVTMRLGTGGLETQPTAGQYLRAVDNTGRLEWANGGTGELEAVLDSKSAVGYAIRGRNAANYGDIGTRAKDLSFSPSASLTNGATGDDSFAANYNTTAQGAFSAAFGEGTIAVASWTFAIGSGAQATGAGSFAGGNFTNATGQFAFAFGSATLAVGRFSVAFGTEGRAEGEASFVQGLHNDAFSYGEMAVGAFGTTYTPSGVDTISALDRIFNIGNGLDDTTRADAFTVLKNGRIGVGYSNFEAVGGLERLLVNGTAKASTLATDNYTVATLPTGALGMRALVTDANATTFYSIVAGGGSNVVPVFFDGLAWRIG